MMNIIEMHVGLDEDETGLFLSFFPGLWQVEGCGEKDGYEQDGVLYLDALDISAYRLLSLLTEFSCILRAKIDNSKDISTMAVTPDLDSPLHLVVDTVIQAVGNVYDAIVTACYSEGPPEELEKRLQSRLDNDLAMMSSIAPGGVQT